MSLGLQQSSQDPTYPPHFVLMKDRQECRCDVSRWINTVFVAAWKGIDQFYRTNFATFGLQLYDRVIAAAQKSIIYKAQARGLIRLSQDD